jgi:hypothetical protein
MQWSMTMVPVLALSLLAAFSLPMGRGPEGTSQMTLADILEVYRRKDRLDGDHVLVQQSDDFYRDIHTRLVEGRLSLAEATPTLHHYTQGLPPRLRPKQPLSFAGARDEESRLRMTIAWVELVLKKHPHREEIRARLHEELQAYRDAHSRSAPQPSEGCPSAPCGVPMKAGTSSPER